MKVLNKIKGISYLYTAKDIKTAILEMWPQMQKMYNIATIEITRDAKLFDTIPLWIY